MKKRILTIFSIIQLGFVFAQDSFTQLTDPPKSMGYVSWMPIQNATQYSIEFFDASDPETVVKSFTTTVPYYKIDPALFHVPNTGYRISASNETSGTIATSDPVFCNVTNPNDIVVVCEKECNGISYAYKFQGVAEKHYLAGVNNQTGEQNYYLGPLRVTTDFAYEYFNEDLGIFTPFYQAIQHNVWDAIPSSHPYKVGQMYEVLDLPANHTGIYRDAQNSVVDYGKLVEKKFDQFAPFYAGITPDNIDAGTNICNSAVAGPGASWLNFFNQYHEYITLPQSNPFTGSYISEMECIGAWEDVSEGGEAVEDGNDLYDWLVELYQDFAKDGHDINISNGGGHSITWEELISALADVAHSTSVNGDYVSNLLFTNLVDNTKTANLYRSSSDRDFLVDESSTELPNGLYKVIGLTSNAKAIKFYLDISGSIQEPLIKDQSELVAYPNPVANNLLTFDIKGTVGSSGAYYVHDLNGQPILNGEFTLNASSETIKEDLSNYRISTNFIILSIIFEDGSVLQDLVELAQ